MKNLYTAIALLLFVGLQAQAFNFNCLSPEEDPMTYVNRFLDDADVYIPGNNFRNEISNIEIRFNETLGLKYNASTNGACLRVSHPLEYVELSRESWNGVRPYSNFHTLPDLLNRFREFLIYHELGHALLDLKHNCALDPAAAPVGNLRRTFPDIMYAGEACQILGITNTTRSYSPYNVTYENFRNVLVRRMFEGTEQRPYSCSVLYTAPSSSKSIERVPLIIYN